MWPEHEAEALSTLCGGRQCACESETHGNSAMFHRKHRLLAETIQERRKQVWTSIILVSGLPQEQHFIGLQPTAREGHAVASFTSIHHDEMLLRRLDAEYIP